MTENKIRELAIEIAENVRQVIECKNYINGEEIEPIEDGIRKALNLRPNKPDVGDRGDSL